MRIGPENLRDGGCGTAEGASETGSGAAGAASPSFPSDMMQSAT